MFIFHIHLFFCFFISSLFGDESELHFWTVALYYLRAHKSHLINAVSLSIIQAI